MTVLRTKCKRCQKPFRYTRRGGRLRYYCLTCRELERIEATQASNSRRVPTGRRRGPKAGPRRNDITRLPQWVQKRIARLEGDLARREQELAAVVGGEPTRIEINPNRAIQHKEANRQFLPDYSTVRISLPGGEVDVQLTGDAVELKARKNATEFVLMPCATDIARVMFTKGKTENA